MTDEDDNETAPENDEMTADTVVNGKTFAEWGAEGGAPKGSQNAVGNAGGSPAPNNQNGAKHHLESEPAKLIKWLEKERPGDYQWVLDKHESYLKDCPFDADSAKSDKLMETCASEWVVWRNRGVQIRNGIVKKTHIKGADGELQEIEAERPENQAINRVDRQVMSKLKTLGVFDDNSGSPSGPKELESDDYVIIVGNETEDEDEAEADG